MSYRELGKRKKRDDAAWRKTPAWPARSLWSVAAGAVGDGIGNGRAAAILLARAGTKVLVTDRDLGLAARTVEMIEAEGGTAAALRR